MGLFSTIEADIKALVAKHPALQGVEAAVEKEIQAHLAQVEASAKTMAANIVPLVVAAITAAPK